MLDVLTKHYTAQLTIIGDGKLFRCGYVGLSTILRCMFYFAQLFDVSSLYLSIKPTCYLLKIAVVHYVLICKWLLF